jgi:hypothetical protein
VGDGIAGPGKRLPPWQQDGFSVSEQRCALAVGQVGEDTVCQGTDRPNSAMKMLGGSMPPGSQPVGTAVYQDGAVFSQLKPTRPDRASRITPESQGEVPSSHKGKYPVVTRGSTQ